MTPLDDSSKPLGVAVDLSVLGPGGENGGIKPFLFETLRWLGRQTRVPLRFFYLTCSRTHVDVRGELARPGDEVVCVRDIGGPLPRGDERVPRERRCVPPPADLLWRLGARVLYCPFGTTEYATPGVPTISTVVDVLHRDFPWTLGPVHNAERERAFQAMLAVTDVLQCNSEHVVERMREHYGVEQARTFTVYNVVHERLTNFPPDDGEEVRSGPFFFYPANSWKHKNHETLLLAYGMYRAGVLAAGNVPWPLVFTGHEDERWAELRDLAETLGLLGEGKARFLGYVPARVLGRLWRTAGALVFPSLHEGFGIPMLEAMAHDVPILCSRDGSLPEVGADTCLFADARKPEALAEGMARLATDGALRKRLAEAGRRRLADFSQDHEAGKLLDVMATLANTTTPYRQQVRGVFPDGWTEGSALLAMPDVQTGGQPVGGRLTLRFDPMPLPRRLRLRAGRFVALGGFDLPVDHRDYEVAVDLRPDGSPLLLEVPDAANLNPADGRAHGVRLAAATLRLPDGQEWPLFNVVR